MGVLQDQETHFVCIPFAVVGPIFVAVFYEMNDPQTGFDNDGNLYPESTLPPNMTPIEPQVGKYETGTYMIFNIIASIGLLSVYLVVKW